MVLVDGRFLELVIAVFACTGFWEFARYVFDSKRKKRTANEQGTLAVLHELIYPKLEDAIIAGKIGIEEFDRIDNLAQPYFLLGGNGTVRRRYEMCKDLPRIDDRKDGYNGTS